MKKASVIMKYEILNGGVVKVREATIGLPGKAKWPNVNNIIEWGSWYWEDIPREMRPAMEYGPINIESIIREAVRRGIPPKQYFLEIYNYVRNSIKEFHEEFEVDV